VSPVLRRALWLTLLPLLVLAVWGWLAVSATVRDTRRERADLEARRDRLETGNRELAREVASLRQDNGARARAARESLDVVAPDEVLVIVPRPTPSPRVR